MDTRKENIIVKLTFEFALDIVALSDVLEESRKYVIVRQILKSGTSIDANVREAQNSESKLDFIHKMKIALKEVRPRARNRCWWWCPRSPPCH